MHTIADRVLKIPHMVYLAFTFSKGGGLGVPLPFFPVLLFWAPEDRCNDSAHPLLTAAAIQPLVHQGSLSTGLFGGLTSKTKIKMPFLFNSLAEHCCLLMFRH